MKTQLNKKINKLFNINLKSVDAEKRTVTFVFSDDSVDRYGEKVDQKPWDVAHYKNNPVVLWGHDPSEPENILGTAVDIQLDQSGKSLLTAQFDTAEINPKADLIYRQVKAGTLRTVSEGFIPHTMEFENDVPVLKDNELLEVSVVAIPANRNALALSFRSGALDTNTQARRGRSSTMPSLAIVSPEVAPLCPALRAVRQGLSREVLHGQGRVGPARRGDCCGASAGAGFRDPGPQLAGAGGGVGHRRA
ncbi:MULTISPECIES: HK97 family phage prohead protease [unclassified Rathayibacter]|uniref:HK97 family phage prohead protease n=1 Tax=unclassified Rathayibacter TaxID=2609250 RepID=UPI0020B148A0|nr:MULTISPECIES: HK97 family phage prohead protease [unclassified Rathayibacter]